MVAQNDSTNNLHKRRVYVRHGAALSILKRPHCANLSQNQRQHRPPTSLARRKTLITNNMGNMPCFREQEEPNPRSATNEHSFPIHNVSTSDPLHSTTNRVLETIRAHTGEYLISSSRPQIASNLPSIPAEKLIELMAIAAIDHVSCENVLRFTRKCLFFDNILLDMDSQSPTRQWLTESGGASCILPAVRNVLQQVGGQGSNEVYESLCNISDPVCQFLCCSMLFVDDERDPFFTALDLDKLINILSTESLLSITRVISFIRPSVQSLTMSPYWEQFYPTIVESLTGILRATAKSVRRLTVHLPTSHMVQVLQTARFSLEALQELCVKVQGEQVGHYNPHEASNAIHSFFERISLMCPQLKCMSFQKAGHHSAPIVKVKWLPESVHHVVIVRDIDLLWNFDSCSELRTITIHVADIDFEKFVLYESEGGFQQLKRVNLVNCMFKPNKETFTHISPEVRKCIRTIANDPSCTVAEFPVEGLPWLLADFPALEVLDLCLNTEIDCFICEPLGYMMNNLCHLKSLSIQVLETHLRKENMKDFMWLFGCFTNSQCELEHLRMPNIWVCTDKLYPFLEAKGSTLKTLDVKLHHRSCCDKGSSVILRAEDVVEVLRRVSRRCVRIRNLCIGEKEVVERAVTVNGECILDKEDDAVKGIWETAVLPFDRRRVNHEVYEEAMRSASERTE